MNKHGLMIKYKLYSRMQSSPQELGDALEDAFRLAALRVDQPFDDIAFQQSIQG